MKSSYKQILQKSFYKVTLHNMIGNKINSNFEKLNYIVAHHFANLFIFCQT
jgi:hypothetical protein